MIFLESHITKEEKYWKRVKVEVLNLNQKSLNFLINVNNNRMSPSENEKFLKLRVEALEKEVERLNTEIKYAQYAVSKIELTDPNFDRPISEILKMKSMSKTQEKFVQILSEKNARSDNSANFETLEVRHQLTHAY